MSRIADVATLIDRIRHGQPVIVVDDESRENEGDLIVAAEHVTTSQVAFLIRHTGGVLCLAMPGALADHLELPAMVEDNTSKLGTAYTVSIEAATGIDTGISAKDRTTTIVAAVREGAVASDLVRPGHVFPLRAKPGGVLRRAGHTEAGVDLCRLAGIRPMAVVSELMHDDGSMMRLDAILAFGAKHSIPVGTIADLIAYRLSTDRFVTAVASAELPTPQAGFRVHAFSDGSTGQEHLALTLGDVSDGEPVLVRMHSECLTGDVLHSLRCDCGAQREASLDQIAAAGRGVLVYLRQEGRGIGLLNKIRSYALQDRGLDTVEANERLGFAPDLREYGVGAQILRALGVRRMRLLTNNPRKIRALDGFGLEVVERLPIHVGRNALNERYLRAKAQKLGHLPS